MHNQVQEPTGYVHSVSYDTEPILADILKVPQEVLGKAQWLIRAKKTELKFFYAVHNAISLSLQERNMHQFFTKRAENDPQFEHSPFTPKGGKPPAEYEYLEFYHSSDGTAILIDNPDRAEGSAPLILNSYSEQNLTNIIKSCELSLEESIEAMRVHF